MHPKFLIIVVALTAFTDRNHVVASVLDSVPFVSQVKSVCQVVFGDAEGAKETQENFLNQAPVLSQIKSLVHVATGNKEEAVRTQEKFLYGFLEPLADNTPVVGQIKGAIHVATGDKERGERIFKGALTSTAFVVGAMVGGPVGAIVAGAATDVFFTGIDSVVKKEYKPFGIVDYVSKIDEHTPGEHFDAVIGLGTQFAGGKATQSFSKVKPPLLKHPYYRLEEEIFAGAPKRKHSPENILRKGIFEPSLSPVQRRRLNSDIPDSQLDLRNPDHLNLARKRSGLEEQYAQKLEAIDFCRVNDGDKYSKSNCYYCCLAALKGTTVSELIKNTNIGPLLAGAQFLDDIVELYKRAGFPEAKIIFPGGSPEQFHSFLFNNIANGETMHFSLGFIGSKDKIGHMVLARAWKTTERRLKLLTTDFQKEPFTIERFAIDLPRDVEKVYMISHL